MAGFIVYDLVFLVLFTLAVVVFLYKRRKNLQRQGLLYLYRTKVGIKFIDWTSKKFPNTLRAMQYVVLVSGYLLMIGMIYLLIQFSYLYITSPVAAKALKVPVIIPLVPYLPAIFNLDFLPPLYFTYWILIIIIIAVPHEFAHGIFARLKGIKVHSTGFGFLGPFLAAFVEPDEKQMEKAGKFTQLSVLAAGTFANVVFSVIFCLLFWLFFVLAFHPAGVIFNSYASTIVPLSSIVAIDSVPINNVGQIIGVLNKSESFTRISVINGSSEEQFYVATPNLVAVIDNNLDNVPVIMDSPAFNARLAGPISEIDGVKITSFDQLRGILSSHEPGDTISITTIDSDSKESKTQDITLRGVNGKAFLGIGIASSQPRGVMGYISGFITGIKDPFVYYQSSLGDFGLFIYYFFWWAVLVSISVALVNMLPLGIFDGGRFFLITVWAITGSKKAGERAYKISTYLLLALVAALMLKWVLIFV